MSILIKSMEMPKTAGDCSVKIDPDTRRCIYTGKEFEETLSLLLSRRCADCPLIEVQSPHGRLIAEKTITEIRYHDADGYHIVNGEQLCELEIDAETVIEAEGSET